MAAGATSLAGLPGDAGPTVFKVKVDMVVLSFTVTDSKDHYINGLKPSDFRIWKTASRRRSQRSRKATARLQVAEDGSTSL